MSRFRVVWINHQASVTQEPSKHAQSWEGKPTVSLRETAEVGDPKYRLGHLGDELVQYPEAALGYPRPYCPLVNQVCQIHQAYLVLQVL